MSRRQVLKIDTKFSSILFPGHTCYPLTPGMDKNSFKSKTDQLNVIFDVIGTPDINKIKDDTIPVVNKSAKQFLITKLESEEKKNYYGKWGI